MTTAAETRAATLAKLREHPGFAEVWAYHMHPSSPENDWLNVEALVCMAYTIGRGHGLDRAEAVMLGKLREVTP